MTEGIVVGRGNSLGSPLFALQKRPLTIYVLEAGKISMDLVNLFSNTRTLKSQLNVVLSIFSLKNARLLKRDTGLAMHNL